MGQIPLTEPDPKAEYINLSVADPGFDFAAAKQMAKEKALELCSYPMILSWKNTQTGQFHPDYECGKTDRPFWIRYAESRGANLIVDFNDGLFIFMILKM